MSKKRSKAEKVALLLEEGYSFLDPQAFLTEVADDTTGMSGAEYDIMAWALFVEYGVEPHMDARVEYLALNREGEVVAALAVCRYSGEEFSQKLMAGGHVPHGDIKHYVFSVIVHKDYRNKGLGSAMLAHVNSKAAKPEAPTRLVAQAATMDRAVRGWSRNMIIWEAMLKKAGFSAYRNGNTEHLHREARP